MKYDPCLNSIALDTVMIHALPRLSIESTIRQGAVNSSHPYIASRLEAAFDQVQSPRMSNSLMCLGWCQNCGDPACLAHDKILAAY